MNLAKALVLSLLLPCQLVLAQSFTPDGEAIKVFANDPAKPLTVRTGDLVIFSVQGGTYPGGMIAGLKVEVQGNAMSKVGVWNVPNINRQGQRAVGGLDMSAFLKATKGGEATVTITPQGDLSEELSKKKSFKIIVKDK